MNGKRVSHPWIDQQLLILILMVGITLVLGRTIAQKNWFSLTPFLVLVVTPVLIRWPLQTSLGIYAFLVPFDSIAVLDERTTGPTLTRLIGVGAVVIVLAIGLLDRRLARPPRAALWWSLFVLWGAVTALWALDTEVVLDRLPTSVSLLLMYLAVTSLCLREKELDWVVLLTIMGGVAAAAYASYQYSEGIFYQGTTGRASLITGERETDPNQFATTLLLPLALAVGECMAARRWLNRILMVGVIIVLGSCLYLTMSRGTLVALATMILICLCRTRANWRVYVPVVCLGLIAVFMPDTFFERISVSYETGGAGRLDLWQVGFHALREYGVWGAGLDNFPVAYNEYEGYAPMFRGYSRAAHNIYLGMWIEVGIVGISFLTSAFISQLRLIKFCQRIPGERARLKLLVVESACFGVLTSGFFLDIIWRKAFWLPWILLALYTRTYGRHDVVVRS